MPITKITCPSCAAVLKSGKPQPAGKMVKCPKCGTAFRVGDDETEGAAGKPSRRQAEAPAAKRKRADEPADEDEADEDEADEDRPRRKAKKSKKKARAGNRGLILALSLGGAALVVVGGTVALGFALGWFGGSRPGAPGNPPVAKGAGPGTAPAATSLVLPEVRALLLAQKEAWSIANEIFDTLKGVKDQKSASAAAPRLAALTPRFEDTMKDVRGKMVVVVTSPAAEKQHSRLSIQMTKDDTEFERQVQAELGLPDSDKRKDIPQLVTEIVRIAKGPGKGALQMELEQLRDVFLRTMSVTDQQHVEKKLGPLGAPLQVQ